MQLFEANQEIENYLEISKDVQNAYAEFQLFVKSEMENKLPTYESSRRDNRRNLRCKPYWKENLSFQWNESLRVGKDMATFYWCEQYEMQT